MLLDRKTIRRPLTTAMEHGLSRRPTLYAGGTNESILDTAPLKDMSTPSTTDPALAAYRWGMWLYAVWGCIGAAVNCGVVFLEASKRVKGWPWVAPRGPGGGPYAASIVVQLGIGAATAAGVLGSGLIAANVAANGLAFGIGTATPVVVKKIGQYVESLVPGEKDPEDGHEGEDRINQESKL
ncbi:hypothetical protein [Nocardia nova]|jgi:hypothetical protein|uniref:hypothetical protein n=1 Tax=Nocardia nova TaxID=37330 RepID=UPI0007A50A3C|nr:hypothetical protein [Nocardia nova]